MGSFGRPESSYSSVQPSELDLGNEPQVRSDLVNWTSVCRLEVRTPVLLFTNDSIQRLTPPPKTMGGYRLTMLDIEDIRRRDLCV